MKRISEIRNLTKEELKYLIKNESDRNIVRELENQYNKLLRFEVVSLDDTPISELISTSITMMDNMGFSNNTLYIDEIHSILNRMNKHIDCIYNTGYSSETLSLVIVNEILDYYNVIHRDDIIESIDKYGIKPMDYLNMKTLIHNWCVNHYWKPKIGVSI